MTGEKRCLNISKEQLLPKEQSLPKQTFHVQTPKTRLINVRMNKLKPQSKKHIHLPLIKYMPTCVFRIYFNFVLLTMNQQNNLINRYEYCIIDYENFSVSFYKCKYSGNNNGNSLTLSLHNNFNKK
jgi:hypothetical protein